MSVIGLSGILLVILVIVFVLMGLWFKKLVVSSEDFLLAGRRAPFWLLASAYLGGFVGGASVSGYCGYGYAGGISQIWTALWVVLGITVFIIVFARRLNYFGRKTHAVTISDFICERYGESLRLPTAIMAFFRPGFITGMQFLAIAVVLRVAFNWPLPWGVLLSAAVIMLYMITAGQYAALVTQWLQCVFQSLAIVLFGYAAFKVVGDVNAATAAFYSILPANFANIWTVDFKIFSVWFITFGLFYLVDPWIFMWAYIGETPRVSSNAQLAVLGASYFNVLPFVGGMALAAGALTGALVIPSEVTPDGLYSWFAMNKMGVLMGYFLMVGLLMTIVSCGSSFCMNGVTILTRDIYQKCLNKNASEKQVLTASRVSLIIVVAIGILSALWLPILVPLWVLAQALCISGLLATTMAAWFWKRSTTAGAWASTVFGGISAIAWAGLAWKVTGSPGGLVYGLHAAHVGLIVSIPLMIIVSLATKADYEKAAATGFYDLGREMLTSPLVKDPDIGPGVFGWLGAKTPRIKGLWVVVFAMFALHFLLAFVFQVPFFGHAMVWVSFISSVVMIIIIAVLGAKDVAVLSASAQTGGRHQAV